MLSDWVAAHAADIARVALALIWVIGGGVLVAILGALVNALADVNVWSPLIVIMVFVGGLLVTYNIRTKPTTKGRHALKGA